MEASHRQYDNSTQPLAESNPKLALPPGVRYIKSPFTSRRPPGSLDQVPGMKSFLSASLTQIACCWVSLVFLAGPLSATDLLQAPENTVKYKLSNLRVERGITGNVIVFDYKRVREGSGMARLAARSDQGPIDIHGLGITLKSSGTIRLQDHFASFRSALNRGEGGDGIEFYFVTGSVPFGFGGKQYLVSNPIRHGTMNTRLVAKKPSKEEAARAEQIRISRIPPRTVPDGFQRATADTKVVPGAPVKFGVIGTWKDAEVVSISTSGYVKVVESGDNKLKTVRLAEWIAISNETIDEIQENPGKFSSSVRTLADGNLVLDNDAKALTALQAADPTADLPKGTPLLMERNSKWVNAYLLSSNDLRAKVLVNELPRPRTEFLPFDKLAIRQQTLTEINDKEMRTAFLENLEAFQNRAVRIPGVTGSMESVGVFEQQPVTNPFEKTIDDAAPKSPIRTWSDTTGKFEVKGRLVSKDEQQIILEREDGKSIQVPLNALSKTDTAYLAELEKPADANPFTNVIDSPAETMTKNDNVDAAAALSVIKIDYGQPLELARTVDDLGWGAASVAISPNNRFLLIGRKAACASLIDLKTGSVIVDSGRMNHIGNVTVCGFTPDGQQAVIGGEKGVIEIYDFTSKGQMQLKEQFAAHSKELTSLCFSSDSQFALSGSADKEARYWEVQTGRQLAALGGFSGKIKATRITPDGSLLLATDGEVLKVYDVAREKIVRELKVGRSWSSGQSAALSYDGLLLAVGDGYNFHVWNLVTFTELPIITGTEIAWSAAFCPDNRHFVTGSNGVVNVWDAKAQSRVLSHSVGSSFYVQAIATSNDGTLIACPSAFKEVKVLKAARQD